MRAFQILQFGLENLKQVELPMPTPGAGQVLVRVHAVSLNYRDLMIVRGHYDPRLHMPRIPLSDGAGEVVEVGAGVTRVRVGDRVIGLFLQNWLDGRPSGEKSRGALGGDLDGMLAEYVALPEDGVIPFPEYLSYEQAATLPCAALTAWNALVEAARIQPGDNVLIQGTGGVSIFALQFAKLAGARVLGTSSSDEKLAQAKRLGLDEGFNYSRHPDWSTWVKEQTGGVGADAIIEVGGSGTLGESMKAIRVGGTIAQIGVLSGAEERLSLRPILMRQIHLQGIYVGSRAMMEAVLRTMVLHRLQPAVDKVFFFEETQNAYRHLENRRHFGKIVINLQNSLALSVQ
jgi:NADPH:quinone reductase-like Zn-dependent oxidoreductase